MKWFVALAVLVILCAAAVQAQDQVRPAVMGEMIIHAIPSLTAVTVTVKAEDYTPKYGWARGDSGTRQAVNTMLINGYEKLARWMKEGGHPSGPSFVIFNPNPTSAKPQSLRCKIGYPVSKEEDGKAVAVIEVLPSTVAAVARCQGYGLDRAALLDSLGKWICSRGYAPSGPVMEIYLNGTRFNPAASDDVAEIRWPVRRMASAPNSNLHPLATAK